MRIRLELSPILKRLLNLKAVLSAVTSVCACTVCNHFCMVLESLTPVV